MMAEAGAGTCVCFNIFGRKFREKVRKVKGNFKKVYKKQKKYLIIYKCNPIM